MFHNTSVGQPRAPRAPRGSSRTAPAPAHAQTAPRARRATPSVSGETLAMFLGSILPQIWSFAYGEFSLWQELLKSQAEGRVIWKRKYQYVGMRRISVPPCLLFAPFFDLLVLSRESTTPAPPNPGLFTVLSRRIAVVEIQILDKRDPNNIPSVSQHIGRTTECPDCSSGKFSALAAVTCTACPEGTFFSGSAGTATACADCAAGTYADSTGSSTCTDFRRRKIGQI